MSDYYEYSLQIEGEQSIPAYEWLISHMAGNEITVSEGIDIWHITVEDLDKWAGFSDDTVHLLSGMSRNDSIERIANYIKAHFDNVIVHGWTMEPVAF